MANVNEFYFGTDWEQSSEPHTMVDFHTADLWPEHANSESGTKDQLADGLHPVLAVGERLGLGGQRSLFLTGVMVSFHAGLTDATGRAVLNIADGTIVRQYVNNTLSYSGTHAAVWDATPYVGQPVYVDDSHDLSEGVTLSFSPLNEDGLANPLAGYLTYCQDEYADASVGGPNAASTFDTSLLSTKDEQVYCVLLVNHGQIV